MDTSEVELKLRDATAYIKASEQFKALENWVNNADVARRTHHKNKLTLDSQRKPLKRRKDFSRGLSH